MSWNTVKLPDGARLFKVHNFTYMYKGSNFSIEVDEHMDGSFTAHGEHARDKNLLMESVSASSMKECLELMIKKIKDRS